MEGIVNILEQLEKLMYKILVWIILIPKTIVQITLNPTWAPKYVKDELGQGGSRFDEYMSPMVLFLLVALIPSLVVKILPSYGVTIDSPALATASTSRHLDFDAKTVFKSTDMNGNLEFIWTIYKYDDQGNFPSSPSLQEMHTDNDSKMDSPGYQVVYFDRADANTVQDSFAYDFDIPGNYDVYVDVFKLDSNGNTIEYHYSNIYIYVPVDFAEDVSVSVFDSFYTPQNFAEGIFGSIFSSSINPPKPGDNKNGLERLSGQLKTDSTYLLAFGLLILPMVFTLAMKLFSRETVSEDSLKEAFYTECYYFTPLSLAFWATYYSVKFNTSDIFFYNDSAVWIVFLPLLLALIWFIGVETNAIAEQRHINTWKAFLVVSVCIAALVVGGLILLDVLNDFQYQDYARKTSIWFYLLAAFGLMIMSGLQWYKKLRAENKKPSRGNWAALIGLLMLIAMPMGYAMISRSVPLSPNDLVIPIAEVTETAMPEVQQSLDVQQAPTVALDSVSLPENTPVPQSLSFYTENFNTGLGDWSSFMTSGVESQVQMGFQSGNLEIQLSPHDNKVPWVYLVNPAFKYSDVQLEVVTTNNGNNANGVSLVCRYGDSGWYEFRISNAGLYSIYAVDAAGTVQQGYNELSSGGSSAIKSGQVQNIYRAICKGNDLTLYVNDIPVKSITDTKFGFTDGNIGIAVSSLEKLPVNVNIESVTVSQPE